MENKPLMLTIKQTYKEWSNYMRKLALEAGIPDTYRMIIMFLARNPGASQKEIAEHCQKTYASISQTVKAMLQAGYITKEINIADQRYAQLYLTEKGQSGVNRIKNKIHEADRIITSVITPEKERDMIDLLDKLNETIRKEL
ncbi:MAG: MarR family winged helix-turn-helix transcriptional regulator [Clostridiaceae bacterium]|nr:MarR family winged helix-turn-helix transcriptional regulator [Clostridiaceae bacterium]